MSDKDKIGSLETEILSQADTKAKDAVQRAERIVSRIERNAARKADEIRKEAEERLAPRVENERARAMALTELEAKRSEASVREEIVAVAFEEARAELAKWRGRADGVQVVARLVREAVGVLPGTSFTVEVDRDDCDAVRAEAGRIAQDISADAGRTVELDVRASAVRFVGGARVIAEDGRSQVDQTFEGRLDRIAPDLRRELHREIFSSAADSDKHSS